mmetsp:Transcript_5337/g.11160  ORF Transcript_5337/g.11160 Transcript_5337/m.11160 type:complete len:284 (-) Transcript_5337:68-919(-)
MPTASFWNQGQVSLLIPIILHHGCRPREPNKGNVPRSPRKHCLEEATEEAGDHAGQPREGPKGISYYGLCHTLQPARQVRNLSDDGPDGTHQLVAVVASTTGGRGGDKERVSPPQRRPPQTNALAVDAELTGSLPHRPDRRRQVGDVSRRIHHVPRRSSARPERRVIEGEGSEPRACERLDEGIQSAVLTQAEAVRQNYHGGAFVAGFRPGRWQRQPAGQGRFAVASEKVNDDGAVVVIFRCRFGCRSSLGPLRKTRCRREERAHKDGKEGRRSGCQLGAHRQ